MEERQEEGGKRVLGLSAAVQLDARSPVATRPSLLARSFLKHALLCSYDCRQNPSTKQLTA